MKCKSCLSQLLTVLHDWTHNRNNGLPTDVVVLDFTKAFDSVPHKRLLLKLHAYGMRPAAIVGKEFLDKPSTACCTPRSLFILDSCPIWCATGNCIGTDTVPYLYQRHHAERRIPIDIIRRWYESVQGSKKCSRGHSNITGRFECTWAMEHWLAVKL